MTKQIKYTIEYIVDYDADPKLEEFLEGGRVNGHAEVVDVVVIEPKPKKKQHPRASG